MRGEDYYGVGLRSQKRKRRTADKILNISIGIVILLILLVGAQFFIGGNSSEPAVGDELADNENRNVEESDNNGDEPNVEEQEGNKPKEDNNDAVSSSETEKKSNASSSTSEQPNPSEVSQTGQWEPIGTVQEEPFAAVYDKEHINWEEMTRAFQYATGLGEDMTLWHVGNGGDHLSAVGVVANYENRTTPYQVRIEWVPNEGWMPVSVIQLEENIYISRYSSTSEESGNDSE